MDIQQLTQAMDEFVTSKGWYQPTSPRPQTCRNIAISLCLESAEVLELFQWQDELPDNDELKGELADTALYLLQLARLANINLESAILEKLAQNYNRRWEQNPE
ncbi:MAG: nucleotide pyrophosphohydrolase [Anaerolineae bacterium]|nr:nucleotide pyrophosphohydrolase [Anaerolineae bacterium]